MSTITLSIPQEVKDKLTKEANYSALVTRLVKEHYSKTDDPEILKIKRKQLEEEMKEKLKDFDYKIEIVEKERDTIDKVKKQNIKKVKDKSESIKKNFKDIAKRDITETELKEAIRRMNNPEIDDFNIWAFVEELNEDS